MEQRHHHRLVGGVYAAVARVVVDEAVAVLETDGLVVRPILVAELDRVLADGSKGGHAERRAFGQVAGSGEDADHQVAPLGAGGRTHLLDHAEAFGHCRLDAAAYLVEQVRIVDLVDRHVLTVGADFKVMVLHLFEIGPEEQLMFFEELVHDFLVCRAQLGDVLGLVHSSLLFVGHLLGSRMNHTAP
jgi:hypothetical protein